MIYFSFCSHTYQNQSELFENEVLKRIPEKVKIGIYDLSKYDDISDELKPWIKDYNVQFYSSVNTSNFRDIREVKNLKVLSLFEIPKCDELELNVLLQFTHIHSLSFGFKYNVE